MLRKKNSVAAAAAARCGYCGRRPDSRHIIGITHGGLYTEYCGHRSACRRASSDAYGTAPRLEGASDEALGSAMIAADYVKWPWWGRLLTQSARDQVASRMAMSMSAAVEQRVSERAADSPERDS
jgi:hypothetical protein